MAHLKTLANKDDRLAAERLAEEIRNLVTDPKMVGCKQIIVDAVYNAEKAGYTYDVCVNGDSVYVGMVVSLAKKNGLR